MRRFILLLILSCIGSGVYAQTNDVELWTGLEVEDKLVKKVKWSLESQYRLDENLSSFKRFLLSPGIRFKLGKDWKTGLDYRHSWNERTQGNRITASLYYDNKVFRRTRFESRLRWQRDYETNEIPYSRLRLRAGFEYNLKNNFLKKLTPGIYSEVFYLMHYKPNYLNRVRIGWDFSYDLKGKRELKFSILRQIALNEAPLENSTIFSVAYEVGL